MAASPLEHSEVFSTGINNLRQHNYQQAWLNFTQVIEEEDNLTGAAYSNRCLTDIQLENNVAAEADCLLALEYNSDNLEARLNLGLAYYLQGKYLKAIAQYQQVIQKDKRDYRAYYNSGLANLALNNYQSAITNYQTAIRYFPESHTESQSLIYNDLALARMMLGKSEQAVAEFSQAILLDTTNYNAYYNRGCAYHQQGKYQTAIEDFTQAVRLEPDFTQAYVHRGILYHQIGAVDRAFNDLNLALTQYQDREDRTQYDLVLDLKQQLFYPQPSQLALEFGKLILVAGAQ